MSGLKLLSGLTRRSWLKAAGAAALAPLSQHLVRAADSASVDPDLLALPAKKNFAPMSMTFLDSGGTHPISLGAQRAVEQWLFARTLAQGAPQNNYRLNAEMRTRVCSKYAALINAKPTEICLVPSTTAAEHLVVRSLNIPQSRGRIVTDTLHFPDSAYLYEAMQRMGMDVVWVKPRDGKSIDPADVERAVTRNTRLIALTLVSNVNGFQHDLKRICEIAHAKGAYVYADVAQAAGAVPVDVRQSNVDFAGCAGFKWLMGDFGLGLLYVREDLLERIQRPQYGYFQISKTVSHVYPLDTPGSAVADFTPREDATGHFATGTVAAGVVAQLDYSLDYLQRLGVENIQRYRQPLLDKARVELERKGYPCMTPPGCTSPILTFIHKDADSLQQRLTEAQVKVTLSGNRIRISPSIFNDIADIDRLIEVLT